MRLRLPRRVVITTGAFSFRPRAGFERISPFSIAASSIIPSTPTTRRAEGSDRPLSSMRETAKPLTSDRLIEANERAPNAGST